VATTRADDNVAQVVAKRWRVRTEAPAEDGQWADMADADQPGLEDADDAESILAGAGHPLEESADDAALLYAVAPDATWIKAKRSLPINGEGPSYHELLGKHDWYKGGA